MNITKHKFQINADEIMVSVGMIYTAQQALLLSKIKKVMMGWR
jgi:hypothetical protein